MTKQKPFIVFLSDQSLTFAGWWLKRKYNFSECEVTTTGNVYECINWIALTNEFEERDGVLIMDYVNQDDLVRHLKLIKGCLSMMPLETIVIVDDDARCEAINRFLKREKIFDVKLELSEFLINRVP